YGRGLAIRGLAAGAFLFLLLLFRLAGWGGHISGQAWLGALLLMLIAINPLLWAVGRSREFELADFRVPWGVDVGAVTAAVYLCGSLDIPLASCAYLIMIVTSATFASRHTSLQLAIWSAVALVVLVGSEELGIVEHQHVSFAAHLTREGKIATV